LRSPSPQCLLVIGTMLPKARHPGQTTIRASNGGESAPSVTDLAVRWLFPATDGPVTPLAGSRTVLGRGEDCGTVLPGAEVSRYHAEIYRNGPLAILRDMGSRNGSFVNGLAVREAPLAAGDVVRLGEWIGVVVYFAPNSVAQFAFGTVAPGLYGGPKLRAALEPLLRAAKSDLSIVLEGETGTGKEVVARAIHSESGRQGGFFAVNCAALPEGIAEAELFGYRRGAFTGADRASLGHFRAASGGTLLLDEIADVSLALQAKILRVLEQREVLPLGESKPVSVDVKIIAAAQGSLESAVAEKTFRADLFARIEGITVKLPPLRERIEDVPYLFARLMHELGGGKPPAVDPKLVERLCLYDWPLNVRELVTLVRRLLVIHGHEAVLKAAYLPSRILRDLAQSATQATEPRDQAERDDLDFVRLIEELRSQAGNVSKAAAACGLSRQRAYRLIHARPEVDLEDLRSLEPNPDEGAS
jgi:transcriptional regulator with AAA-type ATPase domain